MESNAKEGKDGDGACGGRAEIKHARMPREGQQDLLQAVQGGGGEAGPTSLQNNRSDGILDGRAGGGLQGDAGGLVQCSVVMQDRRPERLHGRDGCDNDQRLGGIQDPPALSPSHSEPRDGMEGMLDGPEGIQGVGGSVGEEGQQDNGSEGMQESLAELDDGPEGMQVSPEGIRRATLRIWALLAVARAGLVEAVRRGAELPRRLWATRASALGLEAVWHADDDVRLQALGCILAVHSRMADPWAPRDEAAIRATLVLSLRCLAVSLRQPLVRAVAQVPPPHPSYEAFSVLRDGPPRQPVPPVLYHQGGGQWSGDVRPPLLVTCCVVEWAAGCSARCLRSPRAGVWSKLGVLLRASWCVAKGLSVRC